MITIQQRDSQRINYINLRFTYLLSYFQKDGQTYRRHAIARPRFALCIVR